MDKKTKLIRATIKSILVALIYVTFICLTIYILFSNTISKAISLIDIISVKSVKQEIKDIKLDLETKSLKNYPDYASKYGNIKIPSIKVELPLYYGDTLPILRNGVGHSSGSYFPGEGGSIICMGHNTSEMLKDLPKIKNGEKIIIHTTYGKYTYKVYDTKIVKETELDAAPIQKEKEILMLYTCYPPDCIGHTKYRFFAYANLIVE